MNVMQALNHDRAKVISVVVEHVINCRFSVAAAICHRLNQMVKLMAISAQLNSVLIPSKDRNFKRMMRFGYWITAELARHVTFFHVTPAFC
jgi:hypothetical protein